MLWESTRPPSLEYHFRLEDGRVLSHSIAFDPQTAHAPEPAETPPEWARLEHGQGDGCGLHKSGSCPIAVRLAKPLKTLNGIVSHAPVTVTVVTEEREYGKATDFQEGLRSLLGLIMATSGCPSMAPFRFMARYHL